MSGLFLRALNLLTFHRLDRLEPMKAEAEASEARARATVARNRRDYQAFLDSGLDLPNIQRTLFDAKGGGA